MLLCRCFVLVFSILMVVVGAQSPVESQTSHESSAAQPRKLKLGTYAFRKPTEIYSQFQPATVELSRLLTIELGEPTIVELVVSKTYETCLDSFVEGKIDIARFGPASYVLAAQRNPKIELLAIEREDSRGVGLIVVREDSPIQELSDLVGKRFAFGDDQSTIGRYLSQAELAKAGVLATDLAHFEYMARHDIVFKAVEIGDYDAGALHAATWKDLNGKGAVKLRVLRSFDNVAKPWLARAGLEAKVTKALRSSLLAMKEPGALKALKVPGFMPTTDEEFEIVRRGMLEAAKFAPAKAPVAPPESAPAPTKG